MKLGYVIIYVPELEKAIAFYESAFGMQRRFLHETGEYGELETGATTLAFVSESLAATHGDFVPNRATAKPAGAEIAFVTDDVEAAYQRALNAGAQPAAEPTRKPWGQVVSYVRDQNGFLVEICSPMAP